MNSLVRRYCVGLSAAERAQIQAVWEQIEAKVNPRPSVKPNLQAFARTAVLFNEQMTKAGRVPQELPDPVQAGPGLDSSMYLATGTSY